MLAALGVAGEDRLGLERTELGAGLVLSDIKEVVVRHTLKINKELQNGRAE